MPQVPSYPFEQQSPVYMPSPLHQPPFHPIFQPGIQQFNPMYPNPMMFDQFSSAPPFPQYDFPPTVAYPNYTTEPMGTPVPLFYEQEQLPMQMQNVSMEPHQFTSAPPMYQHSPPLPPQQTTPPHIINAAALEFVPSQVPRNIPKNDK